MLEHTFCHLKGVGLTTEQKWWAQGFRTWEDIIHGQPAGISPKRHATIVQELEESRRQLRSMQAGYFAARLPKPEMWRLFGTFNTAPAYLDIETTGGLHGLDHITTIAVYDQQQVHTFVHGHNLEEVADLLADTHLLITYNGACFDLPYLQRELALGLPQAHIDLRFLLAGLGFRGGLKGCERQLGLDRGQLDGYDGYLAVLLWQAYQNTRDERFIQTLLRYNAEDVINLETLMIEAWNRKLERLPFPASELSLARPGSFPNPFPLYPEVLDMVHPG